MCEVEWEDEAEGPIDRPPLIGSYCADHPPEAFLEPVTVGGPLPAMPLFLHVERYIPLPLEPSYASAYRGLPAFWRGVLEGARP